MSMAKTSPNLDAPVHTGPDGLPVGGGVAPVLVDGVPVPVTLPADEAKGDPLTTSGDGKPGVFDRLRDAFTSKPEGGA